MIKMMKKDDENDDEDEYYDGNRKGTFELMKGFIDE